MDARMQYAHEILKSEDQHSQLWMDQISGHLDWDGLDWDDSHPEIMRLSKPANKDNNYVEGVASKNLHSERKRRKKLNDTLYTLRSVVPKISKMDKESIIGDAISHVLDLQKKMQEIEGEIKGLCSSNKGDDDTDTDTKKPLTKPNLEKRCTESSDAKKSAHKFKHGKASETKFVEICKAGKDGMYHVRMECNRDAGVLVDLTRALESVPLEIVNSNMCRFHQAVHCTFYVRSLKNVGADELEDIIRQTMASDCSS